MNWKIGPLPTHSEKLCREAARLLAGTLCLVISACGGDAPAEGPALPTGSPLGLSAAPVLVVGERPNDPDHEFHRVVTPFLLPDGGIGVPLSSEGSIRIFDERGEFVQALGASGEGPGEFARLAAVWARGDTVVALDGGLNRVTRFVPGAPPETTLLEGVPSAQTGVPGLRSGGWVLYGVKQVGRTGRDLVAVHHFAPDGSHVGELGEVAGFRRHVHDGGAGPDPISPRPLVRTNGDQVYVAETLTPRITVFDVATGDTHVVEWEPEGSLSHAEAVAMARAQVANPGSRQMEEAWTLASFQALTGSEEVSVFWDFLIDGGEFVWVRSYDPAIHATNVGGLMTAGAGGEWKVFHLDGRSVSAVTVPPDFEPLRIEGDHLVGIRRDEFDVESVRVYGIERSGG
ncbi:MAG: 6-bladed beta-propeller [Gemmatimonadota bacterium]